MSDQTTRPVSDEDGSEAAVPAGAHPVRVLVYAAAPAGEPDAVAAAYHRISRDLAGTPGLLRNELLRAADDDRTFIVMSEWASLDAFRTWEAGATHRDTTAPLREYQRAPNPRPFGVYQVTATY